MQTNTGKRAVNKFNEDYFPHFLYHYMDQKYPGNVALKTVCKSLQFLVVDLRIIYHYLTMFYWKVLYYL